MSTTPGSDSADNDQLPAGQRQRAQDAHLNPNEPARDAEAGTPAYGNFGKPGDKEAASAPAATSTSRNDGSHDNPDEFSEFNKPDQHVAAQPNGEPESTSTGPQRGHVTQNQDPAAVRDAQHADTDAQRAAWSDDDPRYAGGKQQATWQENNDKEHSKS
ncbi:hypothetical protein GCM10023172_09960 [Hymenobacter ginsengisoli]|uniref:Uncharacterized protein n=1 Tax=Hymenobacter ginsengisoli TaxID=1051626 RepID=A0ABP8Q5C5_9BACT|nr:MULTISPECIES: hypothetical protein [unclassified Hymenobacter]MBO2032430.1 hypothetical protein [Hymenobacter sp. BT559]